MSFFPSEFSEFISANCNRYEFLKTWLKKCGIPFSVISIDGKNHIYVQFPSISYNPLFKMKTVLVHYDRADNTPGANDNSAAVYQVMMWAVKLLSECGTHNVRIFFTDGEEMCGRPEDCTAGTSSHAAISQGATLLNNPNTNATSQGAYGIAQLFKKLGITSDEVYVLDGCGRGDVLAISTAGKDSRSSLQFQKKFQKLYEKTCDMAKKASPEKWITIPVPYSDNAGFLACGIPAVAITILPKEEATIYMRQLQKDRNFIKAVMNHSVGLDEKDPVAALQLKEKLPQTWRLMHTEYDNEAMLTKDAFELMGRFLEMLGKSVSMA